jgi:hypothetical protein
VRLPFAGREEEMRGLAGFASVLFSLLVVVSGFVAEGWQWAALGLAVGGSGLVLPLVARRLGWGRGMTWLLLTLILVLDLGAMSAIAQTPGT